MTGFMITISSCHSSLTWLVSGSVATQIMTGFMITISSCHSNLTEIVIMKPVIICVATDPETNQVRLK
jgi:hypothetical protein